MMKMNQLAKKLQVLGRDELAWALARIYGELEEGEPLEVVVADIRVMASEGRVIDLEEHLDTARAKAEGCEEGEPKELRERISGLKLQLDIAESTLQRRRQWAESAKTRARASAQAGAEAQREREDTILLEALTRRMIPAQLDTVLMLSGVDRAKLPGGYAPVTRVAAALISIARAEGRLPALCRAIELEVPEFTLAVAKEAHHG